MIMICTHQSNGREQSLFYNLCVLSYPQPSVRFAPFYWLQGIETVLLYLSVLSSKMLQITASKF